MKFDLNDPRKIAIVSVMIALVLALTRSAVPNVSGGYNHLGDVAIFFTAFAFGPWAGLIAGSIGTALADVSLGYAFFAPLSFIAHGIQGFVAGLIYRKMNNNTGLLLGTLAGGVIVVGGYFAGEALVPVWGGYLNALNEVIPNIIQVTIGAVGTVVYLAVARAYPRLNQMNEEDAPA